MNPKLLMIVSTGEPDKALVGMLYAQKAKNEGWMTDVMVIMFGPSQKLLVSNQEIAKIAKELAAEDKLIVCKYLADQEGLSKDIEALGIKLDYVGSIITNYMNLGFKSMVF